MLQPRKFTYFTILATVAIGGNNSAQTGQSNSDIKICAKMSDYTASQFLYPIGQRLLDKNAFNTYEILSDNDILKLKEFNNRLNSYNIHLVIVPIPDAAFLYVTGKIDSMKYDPMLARQAFQNWITKARNAGVSVVDTATIADKLTSNGQSFFPLRDHHWTGLASNESAKATASAINSLGLKISDSFKNQIKIQKKPFKGAFDNLLESNCAEKIASLENRDFYSLSTNKGTSLLSNAKSDVVVVADSFSNPDFGFVQSLSNYLQSDVLDLGVSGGGSTSSINNFLSHLDKNSLPKVIVWVGRDINVGEYFTKESIATLENSLSSKSSVFSTKLPFPVTNDGDSEKDATVPINLKMDKSQKYRIKITTTGPKVDQMLMRINLSDSQVEKYFVRVSQAIQPTWKIEFSYDISGSDFLKSVSLGPRYVRAIPDQSTIEINIFPY